MKRSIATMSYGTYVFDPIPNIGIRTEIRREGESGFGEGQTRLVVTLTGHIIAKTAAQMCHAYIAAEILRMRDAFAIAGQTFLWQTNLIPAEAMNGPAQPLAVDIPAQWQQYDARYTITLLVYPINDVYWNHGLQRVAITPYFVNEKPMAVGTPPGYSVGKPYVFSDPNDPLSRNMPIPILGREITPVRLGQDSWSQRISTKYALTLQGFIAKGSYVANLTEFNLMVEALSESEPGSTVKTATNYDPNAGRPANMFMLEYNGTQQTGIRFVRLAQPPDIGDRRLVYTIVGEAFTDTLDGILQLSMTKSVSGGQRIAEDYVPFLNYPYLIQDMGHTGQTVEVNGFMVYDWTAICMAEAKAKAAVFIEAEFPTGGYVQLTGRPDLPYVYEPNRTVTENAQEHKLTWHVTRKYPVPAFTQSSVPSFTPGSGGFYTPW